MKIYSLLDKFGFFDLARHALKRRRSIALLLHGTYSKSYEHIPDALHFGIHVADLEKILHWLVREKIPLLNLGSYLEGRPGLLVTLDDGYANNYEHGLPLFEKYECPATIFVATKHLGINGDCKWLDYFEDITREYSLDVDADIGYELFYGLTADQVSELAGHPLIRLGAHTHSHTHLPLISSDQIHADISRCNDLLTEITGSTPTVFSYPYGDYDLRCFNIVKGFGYRAAFAVRPQLMMEPALELPRIGIYRADQSYLSAKLSFIFRHF
jgi:peptidoglycan/xylan/chitin deacetylase (PgdA/CDA1 family)